MFKNYDFSKVLKALSHGRVDIDEANQTLNEQEDVPPVQVVDTASQKTEKGFFSAVVGIFFKGSGGDA